MKLALPPSPKVAEQEGLPSYPSMTLFLVVFIILTCIP